MFADDTVLLDGSEEKLERLVQEFEMCQRRKLSVNETKSKIMKTGKNVEENRVNISLKVELYRYLRVEILSDGGMGEEVNHRIAEVKKAWGTLKDI